ncbi:MAG: GNAT family N-acetyltransferase [Erysipelotrichaceae bacterium]|jgi:predicted acetyltransferase|nr:GNAT family N-acetyltransferase [Erysipelotrichaceae bacterium]
MFLSRFLHKTVIEGEVLDLRLDQVRRPDASNLYVGSEIFCICLHGTNVKIGECDLRLGMNEELYYAGNIGYRIYERYRGHGYAYESAVMLMNYARDRYGMKELILTCSPDNIPSRKTLEKLGGELIATVPVPHWHWLYRRGETVKNIYRWQL